MRVRNPEDHQSFRFLAFFLASLFVFLLTTSALLFSLLPLAAGFALGGVSMVWAMMRNVVVT